MMWRIPPAIAVTAPTVIVTVTPTIIVAAARAIVVSPAVRASAVVAMPAGRRAWASTRSGRVLPVGARTALRTWGIVVVVTTTTFTCAGTAARSRRVLPIRAGTTLRTRRIAVVVAAMATFT
jgi:hypothetical protein